MQWDLLPAVGLQQTAQKQANAIKTLIYRVEHRVNVAEQKEEDLLQRAKSMPPASARGLCAQIASIRRQKSVLEAYMAQLQDVSVSFSVMDSMEEIQKAVGILNLMARSINERFQTTFAKEDAMKNVGELTENKKTVEGSVDALFQQPLASTESIMQELGLASAESDDVFLKNFSL